MRSPNVPAQVLAGLLLVLPPFPASLAQGQTAPPPPVVTFVHPQPGRLRDLREYSARLAAPESVAIRARVSGHLEQVHFREGSEVRRGDLLFTLDARPFEVEVQRATAELARALRRAEQLAGEASRALGLSSSRAISVDEAEQRRQQALESAEAVKAAEAAVAAARLNLEFTRIQAPVDGRIGFTRLTPGNYVQAGLGDGEALAGIVSLDPLHLLVEMDEPTFVDWIASVPAVTGSVVRVFLPGREGRVAEAVVDVVDNALNPRTGTIRVRAVLPNPDRRLAPGMSARAVVSVGAERDGWLVPDRAVGNDLGSPFVWVADEQDIARHRKITAGPLVDGLRSVRDGLAATDRVLVSGLMSVRNGQPVKPEPESARSPGAAPQ